MPSPTFPAIRSLAIFAVLGFAWTFLCLGYPAGTALGTTLWVLVLGLPFGTAILGRTAFDSLGGIALAVPLGILATGPAAMLAKVLGLPVSPVLTALSLAALAIGGWRFAKASRSLQPIGIDGEAWRPLATWDAVLSILVAALATGPFLATGLAMGTGAYPGIFVTYENGYNLTQIMGLMQTHELPPPSFTYVGESFPYYFGALQAVANLATLADLLPHQALYGIVTPLLGCGIAVAVWRMARSVRGGAPLILAVLILTVAHRSHQDVLPTWRSFKSLGEFIINGFDFEKPSRMKLYPGHVSTVAASFLFVLIVNQLLQWRQSASRWAAAAQVFLLFTLKMFFFLAAGLWVGIVSALAAWRARKTPRQAILELAPGAVALALCVVWLLLNPYVSRLESHFVIGLFLTDYVTENTWELLVSMLWIVGVPLALAAIARRVAPLKDHALWLLLAAAVLVGVNTTGVIHPGFGPDPDFNWGQMLLITPLAFGLFAALVLASLWPGLKRFVKHAGVVAILAVTLTQTIRYPLGAAEMVLKPSNVKQYVDNSAIADVLSHIPIESSMIVTNDLSYPPGDSKRTGRQTQISGLFGHRCFYCVSANERIFADSTDRSMAQDLLKHPDWNPAIDEYAEQYGWTHLIVRKASPHPEDIPLIKAYENQEFVLYLFEPK